MPIYKHLVIASAKASPKQLASMMWKSCNVVLANGGVVHSLENHGVQSLAYPFVDRRGMVPQRHLRGRFVFTEMQCPPEALTEIDRLLGYDEHFLRCKNFKIDTKLRARQHLAAIEDAEQDRRDALQLRRDGDKAGRGLGDSLAALFGGR